MKTLRQGFIILFILASAGSFLYAQNGTDDVRLMQSFFYDAPIVTQNVLEGAFTYDTYEHWKMLGIGARGNYAINEKMDFGADIAYMNMSPKHGDGQSGISDIGVYGRYHLSKDDKKNISAGAMLTLPLGSEDIGGGNLNFAGFAALRYNMDNGMVLCGTAGLHFIETTTVSEMRWDPVEMDFVGGEEETKYETSFYLGFGNIYPIDEKMNLVSELVIQTEYDYMMLSSGIDLKTGNGRIRGALGIGLDDGAPDFSLFGAYQIYLK